MRGYFPIDIQDIENNEPVLDYQFLFKSPGIISSADLADCLKHGLRRALFPDAIVFVCIPSEFEALSEVFETDDGVKQALERASSKVCIAICKINQKGNLEKPKYIKNHRHSLPLLKASHQEIIYQKGLKKLFDTSNVLVPAPAGFVFVKPSKNRSKCFLRAEEALYETERVHFLAYAILSRIAKREKETQESIKVIFIDTMGIASLAYVLRELYHELYQKPRPRVESFHSYGGFKNAPIPRVGTSLCIISASSSMTMHRNWQKRTRCLSSEVITLITFTGVEESEHAIFRFKHVDSIDSTKEFSGLRDLRIVGEGFTHEEIPLKSVVLRNPIHKHEKWFEVGPEYSKSRLFSLMKAQLPRDKIRPVFVDGELLLNNKEFKKFLAKEMMQCVPLSLQAIVFQDDNSSKLLAEECAKQIKQIRKDGTLPQIINASELQNTTLNKNSALLIVAAVIGRGTRLLSISRDLRDAHFGARHYVIGFQLTESMNDCEQLQKNLKFSAIKSVINVSIMESFSIGSTVENIYPECFINFVEGIDR